MPHCKKNCISLFMTNQCNLACIYCYCEKTQKKQTIDPEFVKAGIDDFFGKFGHVYLRLFGDGEPTIEFEKMKEFISYSRVKDKKAVIELQTNGFFSKEIADYIVKNIQIVWISCDGPDDIQNYYRPTKINTASSGIVEENIKYIAKKVEKLGVRITIGEKNIKRQKEIVDYFYGLGVKYVYTDLLFKPVNCHLGIEITSPLEYAKQFIKAKKYAESLGIFYGSFFEINFDGKTDISCRACNPSPHLTTDGYVTCCDMAHNGKVFPVMVYGKYNSKNKKITYYKNKIKVIQSRRVDNLDECKNCDIKYNCAGGCLGEALNETGTIFSIKKENCEAIKFLAKHIPLNKKPYPVFHP